MVFVVLPHHSYYRYFYPLTTVVMWLGTTKNRTFNAEKPPFGAVFLKKGGPSDRIRTCGILLPKQARYQLRYTRLLSFLSGWAYSPKPPALPTALHPVVKFLPIQTAYVSGLTFILTYILYINTAESAIFFSARLPHCTAISLSGTALLHISATRYIFNSLNTAKIAVAWYSCM